jgi:hypothetical protein
VVGEGGGFKELIVQVNINIIYIIKIYSSS